MNEFVVNERLIDEAVSVAGKAMSRAYAPYSGFHMGAAVVTEKGVIIPGSLVENVSLGLAMCAERIALFSSVSQDAGKPKLLVLMSRRTDGKLTFPCGACLQVAMELGGPELEIVACDTDGNKDKDVLANLASRLPRKTS
ncbi:MAG: cytidine deaminase [Deltaproteobacteria bacterium]